MKSLNEKKQIQLAEEEVKKYASIVESDPNRLRYHLMPPVGLMNDPNGLIYWKGTYHVFYQWMPFQTTHGAKFWGHYTSRDFVHWERQAPALAPSEWFDRNGCYSGSAVDNDGVLTLFYTGNVKDDDGTRHTYQCMAISSDGVRFEKKGVVVHLPDGYTAHFRDPKVWKHENKWYMVIGAQSEQLDGKAVLFRSDDLMNWEHIGAIAGGEDGNFGYMWECPDVFRLSGKDVLIVCPQGLQPEGMHYQNVYQAGYFVGQLNYETGQYVHGTFTELDRGFEFYAPQTMVDEHGRRVMIAWMGVPDQDEDQHPTIAYRWVHALTLPRELVLIGDKLYQRPIEQLQLLRSDEVHHPNVFLQKEVRQFDGVKGKTVELLLKQIDGKGVFSIHIQNNVSFSYDFEQKVATLERESFARNGMKEKRQCLLSQLHTIHMFIDTSSIEIFLNDGEEVFTARFFTKEENEHISFQTNAEASFHLSKWKLC